MRNRRKIQAQKLINTPKIAYSQRKNYLNTVCLRKSWLRPMTVICICRKVLFRLQMNSWTLTVLMIIITFMGNTLGHVNNRKCQRGKVKQRYFELKKN